MRFALTARGRYDMAAVFLKELKALIRSLRGIISVTAFAVASGIIFTVNNIRLAYPNIDAIIAPLSLFAALAIPVVSCFSVCGERKKGTDIFLAMLPLTKTQIILGKLAANVVFFLIPTGIVCLYPIILGFFGDAVYAYSYIALLFLLVFEVFVISLCMMLSSLLKKSWQALTAAYATMVVLFLLGSFAIIFPQPISQACRFISPFRRFDPIVYGKLDISSLVFYLLFSAFFIFVCIKYSDLKKKVGRSKFKFSLSCSALGVAVLAVSVASAFLPSTLRWADVSSNKLYAIDANTKQFMDSLDEDVTLYLIDTDSSEEKLVSFIERYCDRSSHLALERVDTSKDTEFRAKYGFNESVDLSFCIVVEGAHRNRIISADELFVWYNPNYPDFGYMSASELQYNISYIGSKLDQYYAYYSQMSSSDKAQYNEYINMYQSLYYMSARYLDAENAFNAAIDYVTADLIPTFYFVSGHGEKNTNAAPLDITKLEKIPPEAAMLFINTPDSDYSDTEVDMLIDYMDGGGRLIIFTNEANNGMPNLSRLLASVGLSADSTAFDGEAGDIVTATVNTSSSEFSALATNERLTLDMIGASAIVKDTSNSSLKYTSLFSVDIEEEVESEDGEGGTNTETKVVTKDIGVSVTENSEPMLIWVSASDTFNRSTDDMDEDEQTQYSIAVSCLRYMVASMSKTFVSAVPEVEPAEYDISTLLSVDESDVSLVGTVVIGVIPFVLLAAGLFNIYFRKKKGRQIV